MRVSDKMFNYTYTDLYKAADMLWPGEAENILDNPTDEQLRMIVAALDSSPVERLRVVGRVLSELATDNTGHNKNSICYFTRTVV